MFPRVYNLQGNATMYMLVTLQQFTLSKSLFNYIPMAIEILRIMKIINSNQFYMKK